MISNIVRILCREFKYDRIATLSQKRPVLQNINIETAYACNMQCRSCSRIKNVRLKFMEFSLFAKIISELKDMHYRGPIGLHYAGEPLLHPQFAQIAEYVARSGFSQQVFIYTNGLLLDYSHLDIMRRNKIRTLNVSINGNKEYVSAFQAPNSYERIIENLKLIDQDFPGTFDLTIHIVLFQQDIASINELMDDIRQYADKVRITPSLDQDTMKFNFHQLFKPPPYDLLDKTCPILWESMTVLSDGRLNACCFELGASLTIDKLDLRHQTVTETFHSPAYNNLRKDFLQRKFAANFTCCANCSAWRMGSYNLPQLRIKKFSRQHMVVSNGYTTKHFFRH